ncbi:protein kinase [Nocardia sp. AG03]|uniref:serine/threonine-protein kinase n=1 Tax=Nocardia sp. AG03 TaxID=3025312 RepID=UPI002418B8A0|nr:protein kinase [Nocardia sp. AG03]
MVLTDFGIARLRGDARQLTRTGDFLATLAYASPEQLSGGEIDHRSDQYSLGCTLFALLTGESPFPAGNPGAVVAAHLTKPVPRVSAAVRLPAGIDTIVARALAKEPAERFDSCAEFARAAAVALSGGVESGEGPAFAGTAAARHVSPDASDRWTSAGSSASATSAHPPAHRRPAADATRFSDPHHPTVVSTPRAVPRPPASPVSYTRSPHPIPDRRVAAGWRTLSVLLVGVAVLGVAAIGMAGVYWKFIRPHRLAPTMPWGQHHSIAVAYPQMIPTDPQGVGWRDARCSGAGTVVAMVGDPVPRGQIICTQPDGVTIWYTEYDSQDAVSAYLAAHTERAGERDFSRMGTLLLFRPTDPGAPFTLATHAWITPGPDDVLVEVAWPGHTFDDLRTQWWDQAPL